MHDELGETIDVVLWWLLAHGGPTSQHKVVALEKFGQPPDGDLN